VRLVDLLPSWLCLILSLTAAAVKAHEEFEFLSDIIPEKKTVSSLQQQQPDDGDKEKEKEKTPSASSPAAGPRQAQLSFSKK